jgi:hypothetical protein
MRIDQDQKHMLFGRQMYLSLERREERRFCDAATSISS